MKTKGYLFKMLPCRSKPRIPRNSLSKAHPYVSSHNQQLSLQSNNHRSRFTFQDCCRVAVYESSSEGASHSSLTNLRPGHDSGATTRTRQWCHHQGTNMVPPLAARKGQLQLRRLQANFLQLASVRPFLSLSSHTTTTTIKCALLVADLFLSNTIWLRHCFLNSV